MTEQLTAEQFAQFYEAVRGREPFPWQADLVLALLDGSWPTRIDVPTGLGKTSLIDAWLYALAVSAQREGRRDVPLRLCFVVDRRLVVDGAYLDALELSKTVKAAESGVIASVAAALRSLSGNEADPLAVVRMRGGVTWESRWLARPDQPALVAGTIDQFGSRLLFRGYGVSPNMRPINAALVGSDTWLVIDEAHIAEPLSRTASRAAALQVDADGQRVAPSLRITEMSATLSASGEAFRAELQEQMTSERFPRAAAEARKRLQASKPVTLVELSYLADPAGKQWTAKSKRLGEALAGLAVRSDPAAKVVGVVANTIGTARAAFDRLQAVGEEAILLIGRCREYERQKILHDWLQHIEVGSPRAFDGRLFVVATQTVEVGANLDFDALVTECAPLQSIIQRFGRVNRVGAREVSASAIVYAGFTHADDPIYGEATTATWDWMRSLSRSVVCIESRRDVAGFEFIEQLDLGPVPIRRDYGAAPARVRPAPAFVPIVLGSHVERWATTNPAPEPDQEVTTFLHGAGRGVPEVSVAWRAEPPELQVQPGTLVDRWEAWLRIVSPVEWEFVSVPLWLAKALLAESPTGGPTSDLEGADSEPGDDVSEEPANEVPGVIYRGRGEPPTLIRRAGDIEAGHRIVLSSHVGGHDRWGWTGERRTLDQPAVPDIADLAPTRRTPACRLALAVVETWFREVPIQVREAFADLDVKDDATRAVLRQSIVDSGMTGELPDLIGNALTWGWRPTSFKEAALNQPLMLLIDDTPRGDASDAVSDEDVGSTSLSIQAMSLVDHGEDVAAVARRFAEHLGLDPQLVTAVELAGRLHDVGKVDERFQLMLYDGDPLAASGALPRAKSGRHPRDPVAQRASQISGLPGGFRHEAASVRLLDRLAQLRPALFKDTDFELVRHLIVSHHGWGRPLLPPVFDENPRDLHVQVDGLEVNASGVQYPLEWEQPASFVRLNDRYGPWGLALLETIVRLADMMASEKHSA